MNPEKAAKALYALVVEYLAALNSSQLEDLLAEATAGHDTNDNEDDPDAADKDTARKLFGKA